MLRKPRLQPPATGVGNRRYLFAGMVHCSTGHQPLSMQGKTRKAHHSYACSYGASYGDVAAADATPARSGSTSAMTQQLRDAPREIQRQTYEAFDLRIEFDKAANTLSVSASVTEAVAQASKTRKPSEREGYRSPSAT